jgi:hypothetical protein
MKKHLMTITLVILTFFFAVNVNGQDLQPASSPYWVVVNNVKTPKASVVYFYNTDHQVMYKETIEGKRMNINRKKIHNRLNEALAEVATAWNKDWQKRENQYIVAKKF